jgi:hypothetical protein
MFISVYIYKLYRSMLLATAACKARRREVDLLERFFN